MAANPVASLPVQCGDWADLTAAYRLLNNDRVKPQALAQPHWRMTATACADHRVILQVQDTTEMEFTHHAKTKGLGILSTGRSGVLQHSALAVLPEGRVLGLLYNRWFVRQEVPEGETRAQRRGRWSEGDLWADTVKAIAPMFTSSSPTRVIVITDRGGDNVQTMQACREHDHGFVIRAQHDRYVENSADQLWPHMSRQPVVCTLEVDVPARPAIKNPPGRARRAQKARTAKVEVRIGQVSLDPPRNDPRFHTPQVVWVVHACERAAPPAPAADAEPVEWMLLTGEPVHTAEDAQRIIGYYRLRWVIEEFHRAQKEGCRLEDSQLDHAQDLMRLAAIKGVQAVRLLQLRDLADAAGVRGGVRIEPASIQSSSTSTTMTSSSASADSPSMLQATVPWSWIAVVSHLHQIDPEQLTPRQFWIAIAKRGGWIGRTRDHRPGWKAIWQGWHEFDLLVQGAQLHVTFRRECV
jgi:Transposase DNA-binding/Transposase DDE domain